MSSGSGCQSKRARYASCRPARSGASRGGVGIAMDGSGLPRRPGVAVDRRRDATRARPADRGARSARRRYELFACDPALADTPRSARPTASRPRTRRTRSWSSASDPPRYAACVVLAPNRLDVNRTVRDRLGAQGVVRAGRVTREITGMEIGGVTVFGLPDGLPIWIDRASWPRADRARRRLAVVEGAAPARSCGAAGGAAVVDGLATDPPPRRSARRPLPYRSSVTDPTRPTRTRPAPPRPPRPTARSSTRATTSRPSVGPASAASGSSSCPGRLHRPHAAQRVWDWPSDQRVLLFAVIGLLLVTARRSSSCSASWRRTGAVRRRPLASGTKTVGELEDEADDGSADRATPPRGVAAGADRGPRR